MEITIIISVLLAFGIFAEMFGEGKKDKQLGNVIMKVMFFALIIRLIYLLF